MRARILSIARWGLLIWGALSLIGVVIIAAIAAYPLGREHPDKTDSASAQDVRFVLNWCELGDQRIEKVLHSQVKQR